LDQYAKADTLNVKEKTMPYPIDGDKPTSRYLCACPDLDYFRIADDASGDI